VLSSAGATAEELRERGRGTETALQTQWPVAALELAVEHAVALVAGGAGVVVLVAARVLVLGVVLAAEAAVAVEVVLDGDAHLALAGLVADEGVAQQLVRVRALVVVLDQHGLDERRELLGPLFGVLEARRGVARNEE